MRTSWEYGMEFETCMRRVFGDKASHIASSCLALERLGMMRLLHHFSKGELEEKSPKAWQLYRKREWYKERKRADEMFHRLFPFLASSERPLNWPTRGGHSK
jgi:hypothetical protein